MSRRSIIIDGSTTSIFMEPVFWAHLDRLARLRGLRWAELARGLLAKNEVGSTANRSALLRECVVRLALQHARKSEAARSVWELQYPDGKTCTFEFAIQVIRCGRSVVNDIVVDDQSVSREHLLLVCDQGDWWAIDKHTKHGLFVDERRVERARVRESSVIHLGHSRLTKKF